MPAIIIAIQSLTQQAQHQYAPQTHARTTVPGVQARPVCWPLTVCAVRLALVREQVRLQQSEQLGPQLSIRPNLLQAAQYGGNIIPRLRIEWDGCAQYRFGQWLIQMSNDRERERGQRLGYIARNNLYTMFIEAAMEACKEHGCVILVVPHSIVFRREESYKNLRQKIEKFADLIEIRTFDNRPKPVFPDIPWVKIHQISAESKQRVTILFARKGASLNPTIISRGLIRLDAERRREILRADRHAIAQPRFHRQWTQAPSTETAQLLERMWVEAKGKIKMKEKPTRTVAFPQTAIYFVSCLPVELSPLKNPRLHTLDDDEFFWPWIGLYNSHLFHAYWLMTGDAFHVTSIDCSTVAPPAGWKDESLRAQIERTAKLLVSKKNLDACRVVHTGSGGSKWPNMNFHRHQEGREIISILDRLLIEAYDLEEQPLLSHVRMMRTGSAHDLSALH